MIFTSTRQCALILSSAALAAAVPAALCIDISADLAAPTTVTVFVTVEASSSKAIGSKQTVAVSSLASPSYGTIVAASAVSAGSGTYTNTTYKASYMSTFLQSIDSAASSGISISQPTLSVISALSSIVAPSNNGAPYTNSSSTSTATSSPAASAFIPLSATSFVSVATLVTSSSPLSSPVASVATSASVLSASRLSSASAAQTTRPFSDTGFCHPYNITPAVWMSHNMDDFMGHEATLYQLTPLNDQGPMQYWKSQLGPDYGPSVTSCTRERGLDCSPGPYERFCVGEPRWTLAVAAVSNYVSYLFYLQDVINTAMDGLDKELAAFPQMFAPDNYTNIEGNPQGSNVISGAFTIIGGFMSLIPGLGLVGQFPKFVENGFKAAGGIASMISGSVNAKRSPSESGDVEVRFNTYAYVTSIHGQLQTAVANQTNLLLDRLFTPGNISSQSDVQFAVDQLKSGAYAGGNWTKGNNGTFPQLRAAMASGPINTIWNWYGVVMVRVHKSDFERWGLKNFDPCANDVLFATKEEKWCDKDGHMYALLRPKNGDVNKWRTRNIEDYAVPALSKLPDYHLSVELMAKVAWANQVQYGPGSAGPNVTDVLNRISTTGVTNIPPETYIFSNLLICDFAKIPSTTRGNWKATTDRIRLYCNSEGTAGVEICTFLVMFQFCPEVADWGQYNRTWPYPYGTWSNVTDDPGEPTVEVPSAVY